MGIGLIFIGCCFLFNPVISLVDVLPDFFGMILILRGMSKIADLNNHIGESYLKMKAAMWVSLGKLVALFLAGAFFTAGAVSTTGVSFSTSAVRAGRYSSTKCWPLNSLVG